MIGSDIDLTSPRRRALLRHCSLLAGFVVAAVGLPARSAVTARGADAPTLLVVGDSLSAGYGLARDAGWVTLLERRLAREAPRWRVVNASVSGDTTSGGRARLPALLARHRPSVVVIELGGNDALRGLPLAQLRANLAAMAKAARDGGAEVVVVGIEMPPNYGRRYAEGLADAYADVARDHRATLVPTLLAGVADAADAEALFQADRIHPNQSAQARMLDNVWPALATVLR